MEPVKMDSVRMESKPPRTLIGAWRRAEWRIRDVETHDTNSPTELNHND